ncbi:hypothetical protein [Clostridium ganghwense]|uniref:Uncharacterized protein n=1 Tax=Clostridium ganghwense TaxID=312089 RepID=A0ABT4CU26_9CLOT|nr:hypothetical protein [Clostridium ganghwense]MCY6372423.1 hypothetical protein [Clostridium ganghwense]
MIKHRFNSEVGAEITAITNDDTARLENEEGVSEHKKFVMIELTDTAHYPRVIFHNVNSIEQQACCELFEKITLGETYAELAASSIRVEVPKK